MCQSLVNRSTKMNYRYDIMRSIFFFLIVNQFAFSWAQNPSVFGYNDFDAYCILEANDEGFIIDSNFVPTIYYNTDRAKNDSSIKIVSAYPNCQTIDIPIGWSMFSTYMIAPNMDGGNVLSPIIDNVIIAKNSYGSAYLPEWSFNGLGDLIVGQGYQIKTDASVALEICGDYTIPEENPIDISAGWNMIGYLRIESAPADEVLSGINALGNLIILKDYNGAFYMPEWGFNGIGDMFPGVGYQLKTFYNDNLLYFNDCIYPEEGFDCEGNFIPQVGDVIEGGIVFYIDETGEHGFVASFDDLGPYEWGCSGESLSGVNGTSFGTGYLNTSEIVLGCTDTLIAASEALGYEYNGYSDWYLPSIDELVEVYNAIGGGGSQGNIGGFSNSWYWSSSEYNNSVAWTVSFIGGNASYANKNSARLVRVIRAF